jgi:hypothetical protein
LPAGPGQRNRAVFYLARALKAAPELAGLPAEALRPLVERWFGEAFPRIRTKRWEVSWRDFQIAWARVRRPAGLATLAGVGAYAHRLVPRRGGSAEDRLEAALLRLELITEELQVRHRHRPFPLPCRVAGDLLGVSHETANSLLNHLRRAGVLELVREADRGSHRAREWLHLPTIKALRERGQEGLQPEHPLRRPEPCATS